MVNVVITGDSCYGNYTKEELETIRYTKEELETALKDTSDMISDVVKRPGRTVQSDEWSNIVQSDLFATVFDKVLNKRIDVEEPTMTVQESAVGLGVGFSC